MLSADVVLGNAANARYQGQVLGSLGLYGSTPGLPSAACQKLLGMATHIAGIAIERKQAEERIQFVAHHDVLTGLPNRSMLDEQIVQEVEADMTTLGLVVDTLKIQNITDDVRYLDSIGRIRNAELQSNSRIAEAIARADSIVRAAENSEQAVNAEVAASTAVATVTSLNTEPAW